MGLGNRVVIRNLSKNVNYGMEMFEEAGFHSLIAVPIMTYKVLGIMGVAYRSRKKFDNEFPQLIAVIASLVGMALNKEMISGYSTQPQYEAYSNGKIGTGINTNQESEGVIVLNNEKVNTNSIRVSDNDKIAFQKHVSEIKNFRKLHK